MYTVWPVVLNADAGCTYFVDLYPNPGFLKTKIVKVYTREY
jgi:hypothetical protein